MTLENLGIVVAIVTAMNGGLLFFFKVFGLYRVEGWITDIAEQQCITYQKKTNARINRHWNRRQEDVNYILLEIGQVKGDVGKIHAKVDSVANLSEQALGRLALRVQSNYKTVNNLASYINSADRETGSHTHKFNIREKPEETEAFLKDIFELSPIQKAFKQIDNTETEGDSCNINIKSSGGYIQNNPPSKYSSFLDTSGDDEE